MPYGLTKEELVLSLLSNKYFFPTVKGTYLAFGSVGEPFHPVGILKTISYLEAVTSFLGNPIQVSTKMKIAIDAYPRLGRLKTYPVNILVTIVSLKYAEILEPSAPSPEQRFNVIRNLKDEGFKPILFFRPVIPGVNEEEAEEIFEKARESGAVGVVIGGFRITRRILSNLRRAGIDISDIKNRIKTRPNGQTPVYTNDIKQKLVEISREKNLIPFLSACCANTYNIMATTGLRIPCANLCFINKKFCTNCPVNCKNIKIEVDEEEFKNSFYRMLNVKPDEVNVKQHSINVQVKKRKRRLLRRKAIIKTMESIYRKKIIVD
ncbi:MAG: hypothetical protein DRZ80_06000 [Thermoprotei archaeon]|nr:MAG: hypothetical protein DRZ80_06000 [Thermoprotei archaeon]